MGVLGQLPAGLPAAATMGKLVEHSKAVHVTGVAPGLDEATLKSLISNSCGTVVSINIVGNPLAMREAVVEFAAVDSVQKAMGLTGLPVGGSPLQGAQAAGYCPGRCQTCETPKQKC